MEEEPVIQTGSFFFEKELICFFSTNFLIIRIYTINKVYKKLILPKSPGGGV